MHAQQLQVVERAVSLWSMVDGLFTLGLGRRTTRNGVPEERVRGRAFR